MHCKGPGVVEGINSGAYSLNLNGPPPRSRPATDLAARPSGPTKMAMCAGDDGREAVGHYLKALLDEEDSSA
jgi:hypothetical protein